MAHNNWLCAIRLINTDKPTNTLVIASLSILCLVKRIVLFCIIAMVIVYSIIILFKKKFLNIVTALFLISC
jgi:hypothetical protein